MNNSNGLNKVQMMDIFRNSGFQVVDLGGCFWVGLSTRDTGYMEIDQVLDLSNYKTSVATGSNGTKGFLVYAI